jgi:hypothetical protein
MSLRKKVAPKYCPIHFFSKLTHDLYHGKKLPKNLRYFETLQKLPQVKNCTKGEHSPNLGQMLWFFLILEKYWRFFLLELHTASFCKHLIITLVFDKKMPFFRRKLAKIGVKCDHNIDPWSPCCFLKRSTVRIDVMIIIFCDFWQFSAKKLAFFSKPMSWSKFCIICLCFESKTPIFSQKFFCENI